MHRYVAGDAEAEVPGLPAGDRATFDRLLRGLTDPDGEARHREWLAAIAGGEFSFGPEELSYVAKGAGSWKEQALGTTSAKDSQNETFPYHPLFLRSDWKRFHDALQVHRFEILHEILPRYGICAA